MTVTLEVTNTVAKPLLISEKSILPTCGSSTPEGGRHDPTYPEEIISKEGLRVESNSPIAPGETRTLVATARDAAFDAERLSSVIQDADSRFGGLLFFYDSDGTRYVTSISAPTIPAPRERQSDLNGYHTCVMNCSEPDLVKRGAIWQAQQ